MGQDVLATLVPLRQISTGQRIVVLDLMRGLAGERKLGAVVEHIDRALAHERQTRALENRWSTSARPRNAAEIAAIDNAVDTMLTGIRDVATGQARGLPASDPLVEASETLLDAIFPNGVFAVTSLPFADQVAAVEVIVSQLQGPLVSAVAQLGLAEKVARLAAMTAEYRTAVEARPEQVAFREVARARERGHQYMRELVCLVLAAFHDSDEPEHRAAREQLLEPLLQRLADLRARERARRRGEALASRDPGGEPGPDSGPDSGPADPVSHDPPSEPAVASPAAGPAEPVVASPADRPAAAASGPAA